MTKYKNRVTKSSKIRYLPGSDGSRVGSKVGIVGAVVVGDMLGDVGLAVVGESVDIVGELEGSNVGMVGVWVGDFVPATIPMVVIVAAIP